MIDPTDKQAQIEARRVAATQAYPRLWSTMIQQWSAESDEDCLWLMYSANYLFRTAGVRWAIDPLTLHRRVPQAPAVDALQDLRHLSFVLLTHHHADHLDLELIRALSDLPIQWVIPADLYEAVVEPAQLLPGRVIVPKMLEPISLHGVTVLPFEGRHWEPRPDGRPPRGVPSVGYRVEWNGKRWLFPGDTRSYQPGQLPSFGAVDGVFGHVWLGRGAALLDPPPLLEAFCRFYLDLLPRRLVLAHLEELGREADDYWDGGHVQAIMAEWHRLAPGIPASSVKIGDCVVF